MSAVSYLGKHSLGDLLNPRRASISVCRGRVIPFSIQCSVPPTIRYLCSLSLRISIDQTHFFQGHMAATLMYMIKPHEVAYSVFRLYQCVRWFFLDVSIENHACHLHRGKGKKKTTKGEAMSHLFVLQPWI